MLANYSVPAVTSMTAEGAVYRIGYKAWQALLEEVYTTPKPGLVDLYSNGAHRDMDVSTFEKSARALYPYFVRITGQGYLLRGSCEDLFLAVRKTGMEAEKAMFRATGGVNTHRGLIFTLGIFCAAAGRSLRENGCVKADELKRIQRKMTCRILAEELGVLRQGTACTNGERNLKQYGTAGIRGEALAGYPELWNAAVPVLAKDVFRGEGWNLGKIQTLLVLMSRTEDSNVLSRTGPEMLRWMQNEAWCFLEQGGVFQENALQRLYEMDRNFTEKNVSPGGCADLLAAAVFLISIMEECI